MTAHMLSILYVFLLSLDFSDDPVCFGQFSLRWVDYKSRFVHVSYYYHDVVCWMFQKHHNKLPGQRHPRWLELCPPSRHNVSEPPTSFLQPVCRQAVDKQTCNWYCVVLLDRKLSVTVSRTSWSVGPVDCWGGKDSRNCEGSLISWC